MSKPRNTPRRSPFVDRKCVYSGDLSWSFWREVKALKGKDHHYLYTLGCMLQNVEEYVVAELNKARREKWHARRT